MYELTIWQRVPLDPVTRVASETVAVEQRRMVAALLRDGLSVSSSVSAGARDEVIQNREKKREKSDFSRFFADFFSFDFILLKSFPCLPINLPKNSIFSSLAVTP